MEATGAVHTNAATTTLQPPPPPPEASGSSLTRLPKTRPRDNGKRQRQKQQQQQSSSKTTPPSVTSSSFRKAIFISIFAPLTFFQVFRNFWHHYRRTVGGGTDAAFAVKSISKQHAPPEHNPDSSHPQGSSVMLRNRTVHQNGTLPFSATALAPKMSLPNNATATGTSSNKSSDSNNAISKALEQKINHWLLLLLNGSNSSSNMSSLPKPPHTPGAFLHVGKTGGSTLSSQLRNGCHSWVKKPCRAIPPGHPESHISLLTTYYHTPDFHLLSQEPERYHYDFYVWTLRDPFSRLLSAFTYQHPRNMGHAKSDKYWAKHVRQNMPAFACFPTLESFATAIGDDPDDFDYPFDVKIVNNTNCTRLARALMQNKVRMPAHFYYDTKQIAAFMPTSAGNATILAIRTEHLWHDWTTANQWLGQRNGSVATFPLIQQRQQNATQQQLPVTKDISALGQERLCRALKAEYKAYFDLVERAVNLGDKERQETYALAYRNCPDIGRQ